jgi:cation-transporting ATPase E
VVSKDIGPIVFRNLFSIVAVIIGGLSIILILLGNKRDGLFLGSVITINIIVGIIQELRAKLALEKLQLSTKQKYEIIRGNKSKSVFAEDIEAGDIINLKLGDQIPVDSKIIEAESFECNFALLTGESENITKIKSDKLISGGIVVAGKATIEATASEVNSYLYKMNMDLKKYETSYSPIQRDILKFIKIMAIVLLILGSIIIARSLIFESSILKGFVQLAALASTIIAEGLLLASTILFAYGAIRMARQKVLLQQINAIENLGRVSVVCIDKTGTITETSPVYESSIIYNSKDKTYLENIISTYLSSETSKTATIAALEDKFKSKNKLNIQEVLAFSSLRKYSALKMNTNKTIIIGAGDKFVKYLNKTERNWANEKLANYSKLAKRVIFVGEAEMDNIKKPESIKKLRMIGLIIFSNPLKQGSQDTIRALQSRGIQVIVISGDNADTVRAIADQAGIIHGDKIVNGDELIKMHENDLVDVINSRALFARVLPEQKQKIVEAIKSANKSVAMIGDGANDAMAIKSSDLGIAMFDGAAATRQIADAVLTNNSFAAIPKGIKLSDTIITTLEMIGCLFFTRVWSGIFLLLITLILNIEYPLLPRNITLLNIFIITLPILLWLSYPRHRKRSLKDPGYLMRTLPFSISNALIIAIFSLASLVMAIKFGVPAGQLSMMVFIIFFIMSIYSIGLIPRAIGAEEDTNQQRLIYLGYIAAALLLLAIYLIKPLAAFFSLNIINFKILLLAVALGWTGTAVQYVFVRFGLADKFLLLIKRS